MAAEQSFRIAAVEAALLRAFAVPATSASVFTARLRHYQRVGIGRPASGRGKVAAFTLDDVFALAFACNLADCGLPPAATKFIVAATWDQVLAALRREGDFTFVISPALLSQAWSPEPDRPAEKPDCIVKGGLIEAASFDRGLFINLTHLRTQVLRHIMPPRMPVHQFD